VVVTAALATGLGLASDPPPRAECRFVLKKEGSREESVVASFGEAWTDDQLFVEFLADAGMWLYVFEEDLAGRVWKHQPIEGNRDGLANPVAAPGFGDPLVFPSPEVGYRLECVPGGADAFLVVASAAPVAPAEELLRAAIVVDGWPGDRPARPGKRDPTRGAVAPRAVAAAGGRRSGRPIAAFPALAKLASELDREMTDEPALRYWWVALDHRAR
jgi:hypothetical protein